VLQKINALSVTICAFPLAGARTTLMEARFRKPRPGYGIARRQPFRRKILRRRRPDGSRQRETIPVDNPVIDDCVTVLEDAEPAGWSEAVDCCGTRGKV
jgi:hypothetical protein